MFQVRFVAAWVAGLAWATTATFAGAVTTFTAALPATVHQWGIITYPGDAAAHLPTPDLPGFVHRAHPAEASSADLKSPLARVVFSALYIHPPLRMAAPLEFDVTQGFPQGISTGWYPYADNSSSEPVREVRWNGILAGVQADGLETDHPLWMAARGVETAATLKRYRPGPVGSQPDDVGTTEGEVFLFARGQYPATPALAAERNSAGTEAWVFRRAASSESDPLNAWVWTPAGALAEADGITLRSIHMASGDTTAPLPVKAGPGDAVADIDLTLIGALTGSGLDSDEANAMVAVLKGIMHSRRGSYLLWLVPPGELETHLPLHITGSATSAPVRVFLGISELP